jgi:acetyl esterase
MPLHPFIAALVDKMADAPALCEGTPDDSRARLALMRDALGEGPALEKVEDVDIPARGGPVRTRIYRPGGAPKGIVIFLHGGGWVLGAIEDFDTYARSLAELSGCAVVLPDYRLAPEAPFPAGLEDCEDVLRWVAAHRGTLAGPASPLVIAGDSAGGNLATVVARRMRDEAPLALQVLYYPVTGCDFTTRSYRRHGEGLPLKRRDMEWFFGLYAPAESWASEDISPIASRDLSGLPPAIIVTAEYDVLADEGAAYADRLRAAGTPVTARVAQGLTHGFIRLHNLCDPARDELAAVASEIAAACERAA